MSIKNRGAISNPSGRFDIETHESYDDGWYQEQETLSPIETILFPEQAKTIITTNDSPDIGFDQSINPYRGCEHGCIYCYARPSHGYVNLSPGLDFETKIFYKVDAHKLLENELNKPKYICKPMVLGSNTDPYQPAEAKLKITRKILEVLDLHHHPVILITKSALIERDIDILSSMSKRNLVKVAISVTTLSNKLKQILEPRTTSGHGRLKIIQNLTNAGIPVRVMAAPMIPMINDMELESILKAAKAAGASHASYVLLRLPHEVKILFKEWLDQHFPARSEHVMSLIKQMRNGKEYDASFGTRMSGEGKFASLLANRFTLACRRFKLNEKPNIELDCSKFKKNCKQYDLFS